STGKLDIGVIRDRVSSHFGDFRTCYERGRKSQPDLVGRVAVRFVIDERGGVSGAQDEGSDLPSADVVSCIVHGFEKLTFPAPKGGY
ncbi:AgmX/PglI C-terminal domain-containing protein, partial [Acinetobacter baumannii]